MPWRLLHPFSACSHDDTIHCTSKHQVGERGDPAWKPSCGRRPLGRQSNKEAAKLAGPREPSRRRRLRLVHC
jgi:hypothetical protein